MKIAILGGGNGCYAAAADLSANGHEIRLWRRNAAALKPVSDAGGIELIDFQGTRDVPVHLATGDMAGAVAGADMILLPIPAIAQPDILAALAPLLTEGQGVLMPPGTFGTAILIREMTRTGNSAEIMVGESGTLPYLTRRQGDRSIAIVTRATRLPTGFYPLDRADEALALFRQAYPAIEPLTDALDGALMNAGPVIHPPLIIMNAGPIQHFDHWDIHNEGTQPAIRAVTDQLDAERIRVREALGYGAPHFPLADHYDPDGEEWMYGNAAHENLVTSEQWREDLDLQHHRYMREDVQCGLAFLVSAGELAGVETPVASGLLAIAGAVVGEDFRQTGRTLGSLGLGAAEQEPLQTALKDGTLGDLIAG